MKPIIIEKTHNNNINKSKYNIDEDGFKSRRRSFTENQQELDEDSIGIVGAEPVLRSIWISRLREGTLLSIKKYLNERNIRVQKTTRTSHVDSRFKSFKIEILSTDIARVMKHNFWPVGVKCQIWKDRNNSHLKSRTFSSSLAGGRI